MTGAFRPGDMAGTAGKMRNEAPEEGIWDSCGSVGGAGCCPRRERQSSDSCESPSAPRMATSIQSQSQSQEFTLCSISTHSPMSGHQAMTSNWMFWGKEKRKVEGGKRENPNPKAIDPALPCRDQGCLAGRSGWNEPSSAWRRLSHHSWAVG